MEDWPDTYYAVIFSSQRTLEGNEDYAETADAMVTLAEQQPGFLGVEAARGADGFGITVSYWRDEASIRAWKRQGDHREAQKRGRTAWYASYSLRVAKVERAYRGGRTDLHASAGDGNGTS